MTTDLRSACPIAASLDILRSRFSEFAVDESIATNVLSDRLHRLVECGLVEKSSDPADGRRVIYRPLAPAIALVPVLAELIAWGVRHTAVPVNEAVAAYTNPETRAAAVSATMARLTTQLD